MKEVLKTAAFLLVAAALVLVVYLAAPKTRTPALFNDEGEPFYAPFDPFACTLVKIVSFDKARNEDKVFQVQYKDGRWTIPSHEDYPADAKQQLAKAAGVVNGLKKGEIRSDLAKDFAVYGVADPQDKTSVNPEGRGKRIRLEDASGKVLTDLIIGDAVKGQSGEYYVRRADSNRTHASKIDVSGISTRFADWVETDLLQAPKTQIHEIVLDNYHIDEEALAAQGAVVIVPEQKLELKKDDGKWMLAGLGPKEELQTSKVDDLTDSLSRLTLVGVRRKPAGLQKLIDDVRKGKAAGRGLGAYLSLNAMQSIGFYLGQMKGWPAPRLIGNEGEMKVACDDGVVYRVFFGEVVYGEADDVSAATEAEKKALEGKPEAKKDVEKKEGAENRYLLIESEFDAALLGDKPAEPAKPEAKDGDDAKKKEEADKAYETAKKAYDEKLKSYEEKLKKGKERAAALQKRFADWYYVASSDAFKKLRLARKDLVQEKKEEPKKDEKKGAGESATTVPPAPAGTGGNK